MPHSLEFCWIFHGGKPAGKGFGMCFRQKIFHLIFGVFVRLFLKRASFTV